MLGLDRMNFKGVIMDNLIIIDTSGSMMEDGKKSVIMYIINTIRNTLEEELSIYLWDKEIKQFSGKLEFGVKNDPASLANFLDKYYDEPVILITDGCFSSYIKSIIKKIVCILVGIDSNIITLQKIIGADNVYEASDTVACISRYISLKGGESNCF